MLNTLSHINTQSRRLIRCGANSLEEISRRRFLAMSWPQRRPLQLQCRHARSGAADEVGETSRLGSSVNAPGRWRCSNRAICRQSRRASGLPEVAMEGRDGPACRSRHVLRPITGSEQLERYIAVGCANVQKLLGMIPRNGQGAVQGLRQARALTESGPSAFYETRKSPKFNPNRERCTSSDDS